MLDARKAGHVMVARWTAGQPVERSILHQWHDSEQIHVISSGSTQPSLALSAESWPITPFIAA